MTREQWDEMIEKSRGRYNKIVEELAENKEKQQIKKLADEIYNLGFEHGQQYVCLPDRDSEWQMKQWQAGSSRYPRRPDNALYFLTVLV